MEVMSFRNHLRPHQNIDVPRPKRVQHLTEGAFTTHGIAVKAGDARLRKKRTKVFVHLLGSRADKIDVFGVALWTDARHRARETTVVTRQAPTFFVVSQ